MKPDVISRKFSESYKTYLGSANADPHDRNTVFPRLQFYQYLRQLI